MAKVGLQGSGIGSLVRQGEACRMSEHVRMHLEGQSTDAGRLDQLLQAGNRERCATL